MNSAKVGVLVKTYPKLSETFVLGEVLGLEKLGLALQIFSLQRPTDAVQHDTIKRVKAPVRYLQDGKLAGVVHIVSDVFCVLAVHPIQFVKTIAFLTSRPEGGRWQDFKLACALARQVRGNGITHLHAHFATQPVAVAELVAKLTGIAFSISAHAKDIYLSEPRVLARKMAHARFTVTCTDYNRRHLAALAAPGTAVYGMYHGIDAARFAPQPRSAAAGEAPLILAVGRLREKKGFANLIRACALLRQANAKFRCEIVGYGEERERLQTLIQELDLSEHVRLVGTMNHAALIERYQDAVIFAAPCQVAADGDRDGIPNVMLEAMAMQLAVVATPVSGIPEVVIDGVNGLLVAEEDARALAGALQRLLSSQPLRERLGDAARKVVLQQFSNDHNLLLLRDLLLNTGQAPRSAAAAERVYA